MSKLSISCLKNKTKFDITARTCGIWYSANKGQSPKHPLQTIPWITGFSTVWTKAFWSLFLYIIYQFVNKLTKHLVDYLMVKIMSCNISIIVKTGRARIFLVIVFPVLGLNSNSICFPKITRIQTEERPPTSTNPSYIWSETKTVWPNSVKQASRC